MKKLLLTSITLLSCFVSINAYTPLVFYKNRALNVGQPFGLNIFNSYIHNYGGFAPGGQFTETVRAGDSGSTTYSIPGSFGLITYHQNLYGLLDGLFFQLHLAIDQSLTGNIGYYCIDTDTITTIAHIDAGTGSYYGSALMGFGASTWIKLWEKNRHYLKFFNELQLHHQFPCYKYTHTDFADAIAGFIYGYKTFFIDAGLNAHLGSPQHTKTQNPDNQDLSPSKLLSIYWDFGFARENARTIIFKDHCAAYVSVGCSLIIAPHVANPFELMAKAGIAF